MSYFTIQAVNYQEQMLYLITLIYIRSQLNAYRSLSKFFNRDLVAGGVDVPSAIGVEVVIIAS